MVLLWLGACSAVGAKNLYCSNCTCPEWECFSPRCGCSLPYNRAWAEGMLSRIRQRLGEPLSDCPPISVQVVEPWILERRCGHDVQALYSQGVIQLHDSLTRREAVAALAHEYGHAWQYHHHPHMEEVDEDLREGFAEWVAWRLLTSYGPGSGETVLRSNLDPVYGDGLRWFREIEKWQGLKAVFREATTALDRQGHHWQEQGGAP